MIDRATVIEGLQCCLDRERVRCGECPYRMAGIGCERRMLKDALALAQGVKPARPEINLHTVCKILADEVPWDGRYLTRRDWRVWLTEQLRKEGESVAN